METVNSENWQVLLSLFPDNWRAEAERCRAVERLRGFKSIEDILRTILLHVGRGYSLRETVAFAKASGLASVSDVALLDRLRQAEEWLRSLCLSLLRENGVWLDVVSARRVRVVDGTIVREQGRTGSQWRIVYSLRVPSLHCDHFELTPAKGEGTGEWLGRLPVNAGDLVLADAGYCSVAGLEYLRDHAADGIVRVNPQNFPCLDGRGRRQSLLGPLGELREPGQVREWEVWLQGEKRFRGRVCALRKSEEAARQAVRRLERKASKKQTRLRPGTLEYAKYVVVFTSWEAEAARILEWYRVRWQIELAFKRLKSLARLGHLPKHDAASCRAWLYGKLLVALLSQKLVRVARDISPWGYEFGTAPSQ